MNDKSLFLNWLKWLVHVIWINENEIIAWYKANKSDVMANKKKWFPPYIYLKINSSIFKNHTSLRMCCKTWWFAFEEKLFNFLWINLKYYKTYTHRLLLAQWISIVSDELIIGTRKVLYRHHVPILYVMTNVPYVVHVQRETYHLNYMLINQPSTVESLFDESMIPTYKFANKQNDKMKQSTKYYHTRQIE